MFGPIAFCCTIVLPFNYFMHGGKISAFNFPSLLHTSLNCFLYSMYISVSVGLSPCGIGYPNAVHVLCEDIYCIIM